MHHAACTVLIGNSHGCLRVTLADLAFDSRAAVGPAIGWRRSRAGVQHAAATLAVDLRQARIQDGRRCDSFGSTTRFRKVYAPVRIGRESAIDGVGQYGLSRGLKQQQPLCDSTQWAGHNRLRAIT